MSHTGIVDPEGRPVDSTDFVQCPRCGEGVNKRSVVTSFGGWWKRICQCGHVYLSGQGLPPLEDD